MKSATIQRIAAVAVCALMTAGCGLFGEKKPPPPCPPIFVLKEAGKLREYKPGPGRDITDVSFEAQIADFRGVCEYSKDRSQVDIDLSIAFDLTRGPANKDRKAAFSYFVAIPKFHPAPEGKRTFSLSTEFAGRSSHSRITDHVQIRIPFITGEPLEDYAVYLGFQLTHEQLKDNQRGGRL